jgi:hypothetical protein
MEKVSLTWIFVDKKKKENKIVVEKNMLGTVKKNCGKEEKWGKMKFCQNK